MHSRKINGFTLIEVMIAVAILGILIVVCYRAVSCSEQEPVKDKIHTECLDGFEYYVRTFPSYYGTGVTLAPRWDQDGKPKRCLAEKDKHEDRTN